MSNKTKLPVEVVKEIKDAAKAYTHSEVKGMVDGADINPGHIKYAYEEGATAYATKLHEAQQENEKLKAIANLWRPLMEEVVKRFEGVAEMADQDYDLNLIKQIKRFLYGE